MHRFSMPYNTRSEVGEVGFVSFPEHSPFEQGLTDKAWQPIEPSRIF
jgi:hypothetical protein